MILGAARFGLVLLALLACAPVAGGSERTEPIAVGDVAPEVRLGDQHGQPFALSEALTRRAYVVLAFYPKAFTGGWGTEFSRYREDVTKFLALDAEVIGVSADAPDRNLAWTKELKLPVRLLSDVEGQIGRRYGVWDDLWRIERRTTFIVDRRGTVRWMEAGSACVDTSRTLEALRGLHRER